jgi:hypothetical protein
MKTMQGKVLSILLLTALVATSLFAAVAMAWPEPQPRSLQQPQPQPTQLPQPAQMQQPSEPLPVGGASQAALHLPQ